MFGLIDLIKEWYDALPRKPYMVFTNNGDLTLGICEYFETQIDVDQFEEHLYWHFILKSTSTRLWFTGNIKQPYGCKTVKGITWGRFLVAFGYSEHS